MTMTARGSKSPAAPGGYSAGALGGAEPTRRKSRGDAVATSLGAAQRRQSGARGRERGTEPTRVRERRQERRARRPCPATATRNARKSDRNPRRSLLRSRRRARLPFPRARVRRSPSSGSSSPSSSVSLFFGPTPSRRHPKTSSAHFLTASTPSGASCSAHHALAAYERRGGGRPRRVVRRARAGCLALSVAALGCAASRSSVTRCAGEKRATCASATSRANASSYKPTATARRRTPRRLHRAAVAKRGKRRDVRGIRRGARAGLRPRAQRRRQHLEPVLRVRDGRGRGGDGTGDKSSEASTAERAAPFVEAPFVVVVVVVSVYAHVVAARRGWPSRVRARRLGSPSRRCPSSSR